MKKFIWLVVLLVAMFGVVLLDNSFAGEVDVLVDKLVETGALSPEQAQEVKQETEGKPGVVPEWMQKMSLKGDLRLRYQHDDKEKDNIPARERVRFRFRLGVESQVNEQCLVAAGLASGSTDPRSTNQTMQDTFSRKGIMLDYVFAKYQVLDGIEIFGGKMKMSDILWEPTDLLWDTDITPEGLSGRITGDVFGNEFFINTGYFIIDEANTTANDNDPWMAYVQPGMKWDINDKIILKFALTQYVFDVKNHDIDNSSDTNTKVGSLHKYNYDAISPAFEFGLSDPFGEKLIPYAGVFGEYIQADPEDNNDGFALGVRIGDKKLSERGQWEAKYVYRELGQDAWLDAFPDADCYDGDTNIKGHKICLQYVLAKNTILGLTYCRIQPQKELVGVDDHSLGSSNSQEIIQVDCVLKF